MIAVISLAARPDRRQFIHDTLVAPCSGVVTVKFVEAVAAAAAAAPESGCGGFALAPAGIEALLDEWHTAGCAPTSRSELERYYARPATVSNNNAAWSSSVVASKRSATPRSLRLSRGGGGGSFLENPKTGGRGRVLAQPRGSVGRRLRGVWCWPQIFTRQQYVAIARAYFRASDAARPLAFGA